MLAIPFYQILFTKPLGPDIVNVFADRRSREKMGLFGNVGRKWGKNPQKEVIFKEKAGRKCTFRKLWG